MKSIRQFSIIILISLIGEVLGAVIPLPIPASIYGLVIMLVCLITKLIKVDDVKETSYFLIDIMPVMFIPGAVGIMASWDMLRPILFPYLLITVLSTVIVMVLSGHSAQAVIRISERRHR